MRIPFAAPAQGRQEIILSPELKTGLSWTCLDYRHTFGSQLAMKGESLYKIATLMGNSPEISRRHYAAMLPETLSSTVEFPDSDATPSMALTHCALRLC